MLLIREQGCLENIKMTLSPATDEQLNSVSTGKSSYFGECDGFRLMTHLIFLALFPGSF